MEKPTPVEGGRPARGCRDGVEALLRETVREWIEQNREEEIEEGLGAGRRAREAERQGTGREAKLGGERWRAARWS